MLMRCSIVAAILLIAGAIQAHASVKPIDGDSFRMLGRLQVRVPPSAPVSSPRYSYPLRCLDLHELKGEELPENLEPLASNLPILERYVADVAEVGWKVHPALPQYDDLFLP